MEGAGKLPLAATSVASGAILELGAAIGSGAIPGPASIESGGIVSVDSGVTVPSDVFTQLTLHLGAIIKLGGGSTFSQPINVVP